MISKNIVSRITLFCLDIFLLVGSSYGICTKYFQSMETLSSGSSATLEVLTPSGFLQCARACVNLEPCRSIHFNSLTLTCDLMAGIVLCPNSIKEMHCVSKTDIEQKLSNAFPRPNCPPIYRAVKMSLGPTVCLSALRVIIDKKIELYHKGSNTRLKLGSTSAFVFKVWSDAVYVLVSNNLTSGNIGFMRSANDLGDMEVRPTVYGDQKWLVTHNPEGSVIFRNLVRHLCLGVQDTAIIGVSCNAALDISWSITLV